jgi:protein TonB
MGALAVHAAVLLALVALMWHAPQPVRIGGDARQQTIGAVVIPGPQPTGTSGTSTARPKPIQSPKIIQPKPVATTGQADAEAPQGVGTAQPGAGQEAASGGTTGPVRLSTGQHLGLIKKVDPVYPATLGAAGIEGTVVLDAVIRRDGTVGDVTVVSSTNPAFERPAIDAVKQWRYTPLPYDGLLTVTVHFTSRQR